MSRLAVIFRRQLSLSLLLPILLLGPLLATDSLLAQQPAPEAEAAASAKPDKPNKPDKKEKPKKQVSVIAGTTFMDPGFALRGIRVRLERIDGKKPKPQEILSDARGEFAFYLPPEAMKFKITASGEGIAPEEKEVSSSPGVRTDVFFTLKRVAK